MKRKLTTSKKRLNLKNINDVERALVLLPFKIASCTKENIKIINQLGIQNGVEGVFIPASTKSFANTDITRRTLNNSINPLKYGQIYICSIHNILKTPHGYTYEIQ